MGGFRDCDAGGTPGELSDRVTGGGLGRWVTPAVVVVVLLSALVALFGRMILGDGGPDADLGPSFLRDLLAAASWVPVGAGVVWLGRRVPFRRGRALSAGAVHLVGIGVAAGSVNLLIGAAWWITALLPDALGLGEMVLRGTVGHIHANALIYMLLLAIDSRVRTSGKRRSAAESHAAVDAAARAEDVATQRLAVSYGGRTLLVPLSGVEWIEAAGDYASAHANGRTYLLSERMHAVEARLRDRGFARVHRSAIVNLAAVTEIRARPAGNAVLILGSGTEVPLSRRRKGEVCQRLGA